jgi:WD40 repeat protein
LETGKVIRTFGTESRKDYSGSQDGVASIAVSPDGKSIGSGYDDGTVTLWDVEAGTQKWESWSHKDSPTYVAFSPDGNTLASTDYDGNRTILWNPMGRKKGDRLLSVFGDARGSQRRFEAETLDKQQLTYRHVEVGLGDNSSALDLS